MPADLLAFARQLRIRQTDAEQLIWHLLRGRHFLGHKFRRQHPVDGYVLDFYCADLKLAVELDGGQHNESLEMARDRDRSAELARRGIEVVRYWNNDVLSRIEEVLSDLVERLMQRTQSLTPAPLPEGEGFRNQQPLPQGEGFKDAEFAS